MVSGLLFGVGVAGFVDEVVFHQLLHWHHFYDRSTPSAGLVPDGFFHAFSWFATVAGLVLLIDVRRRGPMPTARWVGALLVGTGAFNLFDGTVHHKVLRLHQVRYGVDLTPYDWAWNGIAAVVLAAGAVLLARVPVRR